MISRIVGTALIAAAVLLAAVLFNAPLRDIFSDTTKTPEAVLTIETLTPTVQAVVPTATRTPCPNILVPEPSSIPTPIPTVVPVPVPTSVPTAAPAVSASFADLEKLIGGKVADYWLEADYAVCVTDFQTGETICVNGDVPHLSACVMNTFVMVEAAREVEQGLVSEESVGDLISATVWGSNPVTAHAIYEILGGGDVMAGVAKVAKLIEVDLGLSSTVFDHPPIYTEDSRGISEDNWVTARDANLALTKLWNGEVCSFGCRDYLLAKWVEVKPGLQYLTAAVPGVVSHKNGFFGGGSVDNDIGIVRGENFAYAISLFSQNVPSEYGDVALFQDIGSSVWDYFSAKYP